MGGEITELYFFYNVMGRSLAKVVLDLKIILTILLKASDTDKWISPFQKNANSDFSAGLQKYPFAFTDVHGTDSMNDWWVMYKASDW
jgi:hypothetical protein